MIKKAITLIIKILGKLYSLIINCTRVIYISSNVKILNKNDIENKITKFENKIFIENQKIDCNKLKKYKKHHFFQKILLHAITLKLKKFKDIIYCGYSSQMFSIYDGYVLSNINKYHFLEYNNRNYYLIDYKNINQKRKIDIDFSKNEINLIISTSYNINIDDCKNVPNIIFDKKIDKINSEYLNDVYNFVKNTLDSCCQNKEGQKINRVNIYITAKQSVSFIVGTAIQSYHPDIYIYEYRENRFKYYMDLKHDKIMEVNQ